MRTVGGYCFFAILFTAHLIFARITHQRWKLRVYSIKGTLFVRTSSLHTWYYHISTIKNHTPITKYVSQRQSNSIVARTSTHFYNSNPRNEIENKNYATGSFIPNHQLTHLFANAGAKQRNTMPRHHCSRKPKKKKDNKYSKTENHATETTNDSFQIANYDDDISRLQLTIPMVHRQCIH